MNLDNLLDDTLDNLADTPSIQIFPVGAHKVKFEVKFPEDKEKPSRPIVQVNFSYIEPLEIDPEAKVPAPGDKNGLYLVLTMKDKETGKQVPNEYSQGTVKMIAAAMKERFGGDSVRESLTLGNNSEVAIVTKVRVGKGEYEGRDNLELVKIEVI